MTVLSKMFELTSIKYSVLCELRTIKTPLNNVFPDPRLIYIRTNPSYATNMVSSAEFSLSINGINNLVKTIKTV